MAWCLDHVSRLRKSEYFDIDTADRTAVGDQLLPVAGAGGEMAEYLYELRGNSGRRAVAIPNGRTQPRTAEEQRRRQLRSRLVDSLLCPDDDGRPKNLEHVRQLCDGPTLRQIGDGLVDRLGVSKPTTRQRAITVLGMLGAVALPVLTERFCRTTSVARQQDILVALGLMGPNLDRASLCQLAHIAFLGLRRFAVNTRSPNRQ